jgi:hypothetical protein
MAFFHIISRSSGARTGKRVNIMLGAETTISASEGGDAILRDVEKGI